ncbi:hypothetical protein JHK82_042288 [Glycine max]|uniref:Uncharacterized protein n=3 Tax=Glycine subgen. Soja TaxID=1462606 RepID=K7MBA6_SOYBN|nr:hypothetical protein JHK87_042245 [Glycine soja]KAG4949093.1 hypothetical protein JHK86_042332 [Glycine max]KAG4956575.1 hypothetical protein JHK85_042955 [Glycine max]KAG5105318.1 hypothetical protein JHK82_042288 [Glycine max]KAG5116442.1 hypothetical protein JHK84_042555 [Glycine max]
MEESKGFVSGETQKPHPKMPSSSFPIPLPGRNRHGQQCPSRYAPQWRQRAILGHTVGNPSGASENTTLKV